MTKKYKNINKRIRSIENILDNMKVDEDCDPVLLEATDRVLASFEKDLMKIDRAVLKSMKKMEQELEKEK